MTIAMTRDERRAIILVLAADRVPTHLIRAQVGINHADIREIINEARRTGQQIEDPARSKTAFSDEQRDAILNDWATGTFTMQQVADRHSEGSYCRVRAVVDRARIDGDTRALTIKQRGEIARREADAKAAAARRPSRSLAAEIGIIPGIVVERVEHPCGGISRVNRITLSAGFRA